MFNVKWITMNGKDMAEIDFDKLNELAEQIQREGWKLALAESMTAGFLSSVWSLQTEAGTYLKGAVTAFDEEVKQHVLGVSPDLINLYTAESIEVTLAMLTGLRQLFPSDIQIAITGLAYEGKEKHPTAQVGDVFLAVALHEECISRQYHFEGQNAAAIYIQAFNASLYLLEEQLRTI